jgi:hypothetical protein
VIAHVGGLPVEEVLPALMTGVGAWLILRLTALGARLRARPARASQFALADETERRDRRFRSG